MDKFLAVVQIIQLIASLLPSLGTLVQSVEQALPNASGAQKLEQVRQTLATAYAVEESAKSAFESAWPTISATVGGLVSAYNASGLFTKKTAAAS